MSQRCTLLTVLGMKEIQQNKGINYVIIKRQKEGSVSSAVLWQCRFRRNKVT